MPRRDLVDRAACRAQSSTLELDQQDCGELLRVMRKNSITSRHSLIKKVGAGSKSQLFAKEALMIVGNIIRVADATSICTMYDKISNKTLNCEKTESVTSHDLYPPPLSPLSQTVTLSQTPSPWSVTYFMDGPCSVLP